MKTIMIYSIQRVLAWLAVPALAVAVIAFFVSKDNPAIVSPTPKAAMENRFDASPASTPEKTIISQKKTSTMPKPSPSHELAATPTLAHFTPNPTVTPDTTALLAEIEASLQQRYAESLEQQKKQQQLQAQLSVIQKKTLDMKADYYVKVQQIENRPMTMQSIAGAIARLTQETNLEISKLNVEYDKLLAQAGLLTQLSLSGGTVTLQSNYQTWNMESYSNGLSGTVWSPTSTTRYQYSCMSPGNCTMYSY